VDTVDLVQGGHVRLLCTDEDVIDAKVDFDAARDAGADVSKVEWLSKDEVEEVSSCNNFRPYHNQSYSFS
jgi:hypothetical protein